MVWSIHLTPEYMQAAKAALPKWNGNPQHGRPYNNNDTLRGICGQVAVCQASGVPYEWVSRNAEIARGYDEIFLGHPVEVRTTASPYRGMRINKYEYENPRKIAPRKIYVMADSQRWKIDNPVIDLIGWEFFENAYRNAVPGKRVSTSKEPFWECPRELLRDRNFEELIEGLLQKKKP